jgi:hypothetical protein
MLDTRFGYSPLGYVGSKAYPRVKAQVEGPG